MHNMVPTHSFFFGASVGFAGFTVGGGYGKDKDIGGVADTPGLGEAE